jgi:7-cyano-7-deazaguanine reductase
MTQPSTDHLTVLGSKVDGSLEASQLETFDAPNVSIVKFETHEFTSLCPVTNQPDLYTVTIIYAPTDKCVESKSLKLYLTKFRNTGIFGEAVAATLADDLFGALAPSYIRVSTVQQVRGGLQMTSEAERHG